MISLLRYDFPIKRRFFIFLAYLCFVAAFLGFTLLLASAQSPVVFALDRGQRSHWLYASQGTVGYRWINPRAAGTPAWTSTSEDTWYYYPLENAVTKDHHFLGFGYAHQSSPYRGESGRCWINLILLTVLVGAGGARLAFGPASAAPLETIQVAVPSSHDPETVAIAPILAYSSGSKTPIPHSIGIRIFSAATATFFAGLIVYFLYRSTQTLGGVLDWIAAIVVAAGGATLFFLITIGVYKRRV
jgi:hypothetical protein